MPLAGCRAVDAFGCDVRTSVWKHQVRPSGGTRQLQQRAGGAGGAVGLRGAEVRPKQRCAVH